MVVSKILFFAEKEHLLAYGRPITGDVYVCMEHGPVPSAGLNMMRGKGAARQKAAYQAKLQTLANNEIRVISSPNLNCFSRSDLRELDAAVAKYGDKTVAQLRLISHDEPAWKKTPENDFITFELMFEGRDDASLTLELLSAHEAEISR